MAGPPTATRLGNGAWEAGFHFAWLSSWFLVFILFSQDMASLRSLAALALAL